MQLSGLAHCPSFQLATNEFSIIKFCFPQTPSPSLPTPHHYFSLFYFNNPSPVSRPQNWIDLRLRSLQFAWFGWGFRFSWEIASQTTEATIWLSLVTQSEFTLLKVNNDFCCHSTGSTVFVLGNNASRSLFSSDPFRTPFLWAKASSWIGECQRL